MATNYTAIVGIDFGTTRSGYYFAFTSNPARIFPNANWPDAPPEGKTLTEILLLRRNDLSVVAFGFEARNTFVAMEDKSNLLYFANFKPILHNREGAVRSTVKATNCDTTIPTQTLISKCIDVIKRKATEQLRTSRVVEFDETRVCWVLTVPAIWDMPARMAMQSAAEKAGILSQNFICALEPEAAVLSCIDDEPELSRNGTLGRHDFMVVDAGGGTVDITVHQNRTDGLVELHSPTGGMWGSFYINKKFEELLEELFGQNNISEVRSYSDWYTTMDIFEVNFNPERPSVFIPVGPIVPRDLAENTISERINTYNANHGVALRMGRGNMLNIATVLPSFFESFVVRITNHVSTLLSQPALQNVRYLFLVGGFAQCPVLRRRIKDTFNNRVTVIVPPVPGISVMRGAAIWI